MTPDRLKSELVSAARRIGFDLVGVAPAGGWPSGAHLEPWLDAGYQGEMRYLEKNPHARADPRHHYEWARSAVVVGLDYRTDDAAPPAARRPVSRYAWGDDYHDHMSKMLAALKREALRLGGGEKAHYVVDISPVLERAAAAAAGLGWQAKNAMLIDERRGSYFFLGALFVPFDLPPDRAAPGRCGTCERCLDACPTRAFVAPHVLDARRCISYLTIELEGPIPRELRAPMGEMVFGCDICQDVCPWNAHADRVAPPRSLPIFRPRPGLATGALADLAALAELTVEEFRARFKGSPLKRARRHGLARNACVALGNRGDPDALPVLARVLAADPHPVVRGHAAWAVGEIGRKNPGVAADARALLAAAVAADADMEVREEAGLAIRGLSAADQRG